MCCFNLCTGIRCYARQNVTRRTVAHYPNAGLGKHYTYCLDNNFYDLEI